MYVSVYVNAIVVHLEYFPAKLTVHCIHPFRNMLIDKNKFSFIEPCCLVTIVCRRVENLLYSIAYAMAFSHDSVQCTRTGCTMYTSAKWLSPSHCFCLAFFFIFSLSIFPFRRIRVFFNFHFVNCVMTLTRTQIHTPKRHFRLFSKYPKS